MNELKFTSFEFTSEDAPSLIFEATDVDAVPSYTYATQISDSKPQDTAYMPTLYFVDIIDFIVPVNCPDKEVMGTAIEWYNELDIQLDIVNTHLAIDNDEFVFLKNIIGSRVDTNNGENTLTSLLENIQLFHSFYKIVKKFKPLCKEEKGPTKNAIRDTKNYEHPANSKGWSVVPKNDKESVVEGFDDSSKSSEIPFEIESNVLFSKGVMSSLCVVYNTLFNISIVIHVEEQCLKNILAIFTDFECVGTLHNITTGQCELLNNFFHKKEFTSRGDIDARFDAFKKLYLGSDSSEKETVVNEKEQVISAVQTLFLIDKEPVHRIKATELYQKISLFMKLEHFLDDTKKGSLNRRLASYLLEMGLVRKRFSDGIYYYGIRPKAVVASKPESFKEICERRQKEVEDVLKTTDAEKLAAIRKREEKREEDPIVRKINDLLTEYRDRRKTELDTS
jgi:hypothetical protein